MSGSQYEGYTHQIEVGVTTLRVCGGTVQVYGPAPVRIGSQRCTAIRPSEPQASRTSLCALALARYQAPPLVMLK